MHYTMVERTTNQSFASPYSNFSSILCVVDTGDVPGGAHGWCCTCQRVHIIGQRDDPTIFEVCAGKRHVHSTLHTIG